MSTPKFKHDCDGCKFLGHAKGKDWYVCEENGRESTRSLIARFGDEGSQYRSGGIFECEVVTRHEKEALSLGLELTDVEAHKLAKILLKEMKGKFSIDERAKFDPEMHEGKLLEKPIKIGKADYFGWDDWKR